MILALTKPPHAFRVTYSPGDEPHALSALIHLASKAGAPLRWLEVAKAFRAVRGGMPGKAEKGTVMG